MIETAKPVTQLVTQSKLKILVVGDWGAGKTFLLGTAGSHEQLGPVLFLSLEGGLDSVSHMPGVYYEDITSIQQLEDIRQTLHNSGGVWKGVKFNSVAIDSASEMQTLDVDDIVTAQINKNKNKNSRTIDIVYLEDYGTSTRRLARIFRSFRDLDMHTYFTCLPKYTRSDSGAVLSIDPLMTPKLAGLFRGYMSFIWYIYIAPDRKDNKDKRWLMTESNGTIKCKTRGHGFNTYLRDKFSHVIPQEYMHLGWIYDQFVRTQRDATGTEKKGD